ncbi:MAG: rhomboid family intramembrane serine protease [bacterium]|nr:rhomboid family intramembrane serine protease [bacterium]
MPVDGSATSTLVMAALATELTCTALVLKFGNAIPSWGQVVLGAGVVAAFVTVMITALRGYRMEQESPAWLSVEPEGLRVLDRNSRPATFLPHHQISSLELRKVPVGALLIGISNGRRLGIRLRLLDTAEDALRLADEIRARIAALPEGADQLEALDKRNAAGARVASAWPHLTCVVVLILTAVAALQMGLAATDGEWLIALGANSGEKILQGEFWRPWTAGLIHLGFLHIAMNASGLLLTGFLIEHLLGSARFGLLLGLSSLVGCIASAWALPTQTGAGASAGITGAIGAWVGLHLWRREELPASARLSMPDLVALLVVIAAGDFLLPQMGHIAHLGGFLAGLALIPLLVHRVPLHELSQRVPAAIHRAALFVGLTYAAALASILVAALRLV